MRTVTVIEEDGTIGAHPRAYRDQKEGTLAAFSLGAMSTTGIQVEPVLYARLRDVREQIVGLKEELKRHENGGQGVPAWRVLHAMIDEAWSLILDVER